eukprot:scpid75432/ scgid10918/ 
MYSRKRNITKSISFAPIPLRTTYHYFLQISFSSFPVENVEAVGDHQYHVKSFGRTRLVSFETPSCSCEDWNLRALPCKHMFAVFKNVPGCSWESLPEAYRSSPKMTLDIDLGDGEVQSEDLAVPEEVNNSPHDEVVAQLSNPVSNEIPLHRTQQQQCRLEARQARNMLKVIDAQTFVCTDSSALKNLCAQLEKLSEEFAKSLPTDESGLVIQEASSFTLNQHFSARRRLHETYSTAVPDPALQSGHAKRGRPAVERHLRCRVGVSGETERRQFLQAQQREKASTRPGSVTLTALTGSSSIQQAAAPEPARLLHSAGATLYPMPATSVPVFATDGLQQRTRCNTGP